MDAIELDALPTYELAAIYEATRLGARTEDLVAIEQAFAARVRGLGSFRTPGRVWVWDEAEGRVTGLRLDPANDRDRRRPPRPVRPESLMPRNHGQRRRGGRRSG